MKSTKAWPSTNITDNKATTCQSCNSGRSEPCCRWHLSWNFVSILKFMLTFLTRSHLKYQEPRDILNSQGVLVHPIKWKKPGKSPRWTRFSHHSRRPSCLETVWLCYWATSHQPLFAAVLVCNGQNYIPLQRQTKMRNHPAQQNNIKQIKSYSTVKKTWLLNKSIKCALLPRCRGALVSAAFA